MTDQQDQQWLDALAGKAHPDADARIVMQAQVLRKAMQARRQSQIEQAVERGDTEYQQLLFRLRKENLFLSAGSRWRYSIWAIAATLVMGTALVTQFQLLRPDAGDEANVLRGGANTQVLMVNEPEVKLKELQSGLNVAGTQFSIKRGENGSVVIIIPSPNEKATAFLVSQRLEAVPGVSVFIELRPLSPARPK